MAKFNLTNQLFTQLEPAALSQLITLPSEKRKRLIDLAEFMRFDGSWRAENRLAECMATKLNDLQTVPEEIGELLSPVCS